MSSCLPCGGPPSVTKLLARCYPAGPTTSAKSNDVSSIRPLRSELADLVSALKEWPGQLSKVAADLEKRVGKDTSRMASGDSKPLFSLLISLSILKSLIVDFRADLKPLARPTIRICQLALHIRDSGNSVDGGLDLEVIGRAVTVFSAFSSYSRAETVTSDSSTFSTYLLVLRKLASMAIHTPSSEKPNEDLKYRIRIIALSGIYASLTSFTLFGSSADDFGKQVGIIVTPLLAIAFEAQMDQVKTQSDRVEREASNDRRAPSIRAHRISEKAPDSTTVLHLALKSLYDLIAQSQTTQVSAIVDTILGFLDKTNGWQDVERCCWLAERLTEGAMLQYRYVVPTRLIELLVAMKDIEPGPKQTTILAMTMTILNSEVSLVGLGVIYILDSLVGLTIRRIRCDPQDALLPPLVQCVASLATHVYYVDQVNEMVEEIAYRLPDIPSSDTSRTHIVRVLVYCIIGVMHVAQQGDRMEANRSPTPRPDAAKGKGPQLSGMETPRPARSRRRTPVSPDVWQETLPLLCESTYAVRSAYARALVLFIENELPREDKNSAGCGEPAAYRFCNALHATVYTLAMSSFLGTGSPAPSIASPKQLSPTVQPTELPAVDSPTLLDTENEKPITVSADDGISAPAPVPGTETASDSKPPTPSDDKREKPEKGVSFNITEPTPLDTPTGTGQLTPSKRNSRSIRRVSLPLNRMTSSLPVLESFDNVATPYDYSAILKVLEEVYKAVPLSALCTGVPMLLALDADAGNELIKKPGDESNGSWVLERRRAIRETVAFCWNRLGQQWGIREIEDLVNKAVDLMPEPLVVPNYQPLPEYTILPPPDQAFSFQPHETEGESSSASRPLLDRDTLLEALISSGQVQRASGWDRERLMRRLDTTWSVENALKNSVDRGSDSMISGYPHTNANVNGNASTHSFLRPQSRIIDVHDLRLALDVRSEGIASREPSLRSASLRAGTGNGTGPGSATIPGSEYTESGRPRSRLGPYHGHAHQDMKEVLKDIFKGHKDQEQSRIQAQAQEKAQGQGQRQAQAQGNERMDSGGDVGSGSGSGSVDKMTEVQSGPNLEAAPNGHGAVGHAPQSGSSPKIGTYPIELGKVIA